MLATNFKSIFKFRKKLFLYIIQFTSQLVDCHVTLTFPEARFPPLDFLDSFRTEGQCGVPKSTRSLTTNFEVGKPYNITWKMQYPHQGGFNFELFDAYGNLVEQLTSSKFNSNDFFEGLEDQTLESHSLTFKHECKNCTLKMERQTLEWGKTYRFRSCAEVNISKFLPVDAQCSGKGKLLDGKTCECEKNFSGKLCQYEDDCTSDFDCSNGGKCINNGISPNQKSCFCPYGHYGINCKKRSYPIGNEEFNSNEKQCFAYDYISKKKNLKYGMFNENCFKKIDLNNGDFVYARINEIEIILDYKTKSWLALGWRPTNIPILCRSFPNLSADAIPSTNGFQNNLQSTRNGGLLLSAFTASLHPMDCVDIVMASISENNLLHILDMYTRDRSTPLNDVYFDGEQSITAAFGQQTPDGRSIVMFRRMIQEIEPTDHPLGPGKIHLIYAKGQTYRGYNHSSKSALDKDGGKHVRNKQFYQNDQWKYHGGKNRGTLKIELVSKGEMTKFKSPLLYLQKHNQKTETTEIEKTTIAESESFPSSQTSTVIASINIINTGVNTSDNFNIFSKPKTESEPLFEPKPKTKPTFFKTDLTTNIIIVKNIHMQDLPDSAMLICATLFPFMLTFSTIIISTLILR